MVLGMICLFVSNEANSECKINSTDRTRNIALVDMKIWNEKKIFKLD
jgi:hypothetical protein